MIQCQVHTDDFRGDHAKDVVIAVEPRPDETVAAFASRVLHVHAAQSGACSAHVEIRLIANEN